VRVRAATLTQKGQVAIPQEIRARLGLKPRDRVVFELDGAVALLRPFRSKLLEGYGAVGPRRRLDDLRAPRQEFERGLAEEASSES
jgi:AbrB family looped-hinge helix DNA binding protein